MTVVPGKAAKPASRPHQAEVLAHDGETAFDVRKLPITLTVEETARVLRVSRGVAYEAVRAGEIPAIRVGRCLRVPRCRLLELLGEPLVAQEPSADELPGDDR